MRRAWLLCMAGVLASGFGAAPVRAQEAGLVAVPSPGTAIPGPDDDSLLAQNASQASPIQNDLPSTGGVLGLQPSHVSPSAADITPDDQSGKQSKRILWIIPNYRAVSVNTQLPPLGVKEKFWLATEDTFDYSDFIYVAGLAGIGMAQKSYPAFGHGAAGYGRYYWHSFVDGAIENYMVEAAMPALTREDPRYYTLGRGGFFKRTGYAFSRLFITRTDSGNSTFNFSEIVGAGAAAGISNVYYPRANVLVKTYQRWETQVALDGLFNVLKEFWPDVNQAVFHGKY